MLSGYIRIFNCKLVVLLDLSNYDFTVLAAESHKVVDTEGGARETRPSTQHMSRASRHVDRRKTMSAAASGDSRRNRKQMYALLCDGCPTVTRAKLTSTGEGIVAGALTSYYATIMQLLAGR